MTGWIVFGSIVLFLVWLFSRSVTVTVDYENKLDYTVKFLFIKLYPREPRKKKPKPKKAEENKSSETETVKPSEKTGEISEETGTPSETAEKPLQQTAATEETKRDKNKQPKKAQKSKIELDLEMIMDYVQNASPPIKRLFKKIRWYDINIDYVVGSDDAAKTAIRYGTVCAVVYSYIEWLTTYFTAKVEEVNIEADFLREKDDIFVFFNLKLRLSAAISCAVWLAVRVLKTYLKYNKTQPRKRKN